MDSVLEKFSVFDFFNLICTGAVFLIGLQFMGIRVHTFFAYLCSIDISKENNFISLVFYLAVILGVCYVVGSCMQELGAFLQKKIFRIQENAISSFLNNPNTIRNEVKRQVYIEEAKKLFKKKGIHIKGNKFTEEQCNYFFAYCVYYIQVREHHKKTEKMRELHGISNMLSTCFAILPIIGVVIHLINAYFIDFEFVENISFTQIIIFICVFIFLATVFWFRMKKNILYRIRMVLGIFEASIDKDLKRDEQNRCIP